MVEVEGRTTRDVVSGFSQRITYLLGGALTAAIYYGILVAGLLLLRDTVPYLLVVVVSHFATVVIVYPWYRLVVFSGAGVSWLVGYLRFYAVGLSFLLSSVIGLPILVELIGISIFLAQALVIMASVSISYLIHRSWTFRAVETSRIGKMSHQR
ncbi:GtrA family protein [Nonomuraea sp. NPDC049269]|uniref:GtrA family protein n=1 Tax=Nonomuraea sp. NPDC049269 TaxID=3364349 RepID=UPI003716DACF